MEVLGVGMAISNVKSKKYKKIQSKRSVKSFTLYLGRLRTCLKGQKRCLLTNLFCPLRHALSLPRYRVNDLINCLLCIFLYFCSLYLEIAMPTPSTSTSSTSTPKIIVLDDDPTGSQTVHSCLLLMQWDIETLRLGLRDPAPIFFILTNTRSLLPQKVPNPL